MKKRSSKCDHLFKINYKFHFKWRVVIVVVQLVHHIYSRLRFANRKMKKKTTATQRTTLRQSVSFSMFRCTIYAAMPKIILILLYFITFRLLLLLPFQLVRRVPRTYLCNVQCVFESMPIKRRTDIGSSSRSSSSNNRKYRKRQNRTSFVPSFFLLLSFE